MEGQKLFFTSDGYDFLEGYTKELYGERGTFEHNLRRYLCSYEFQMACKAPKDIESIPELSFEEIKNVVQREQHFRELSTKVTDLYTELTANGKMTDADILEYAGVLGLCPGHCDWYETLFPHLVDLFVSTEEEGHAIWKRIEEKVNVVSVMVGAMTDGMRDYQIINVHGHDRYSKGYARNYFRGESAYYGESRPSIFRNLPKDPTEKKLHMVLGQIRMIDFSLWLNTLSFVKHWPYGDVFHGAIAQHYGIPTNGMDITSDIKTALFFACCRYENGKWRPLKPEEFEHADSRKSVADKGGDSRYGILFSAPVDVANMSRAAQIPGLHLTYATPIGYQPFMRCASQSGFIVEAGEPYDMYRDHSFRKIKFRHTEEICQWIFKEMAEGALIYPNESFGICDDVVEKVKHSTTFTGKAFQIAIHQLKLDAEQNEIERLLIDKGYRFVDGMEWCTPERMQELETQWSTNVTNNPQLQATARYRFGFCIGGHVNGENA